MIDINTVHHIYIATGYTDLRKAADGCSAIVQYDLMWILSPETCFSSAINQEPHFRLVNSFNVYFVKTGEIVFCNTKTVVHFFLRDQRGWIKVCHTFRSGNQSII